jgi:uncharacterized protein
VDDPDDLDLPYWAGVLPLRRVAGPPEPDPGVAVAAPDYVIDTGTLTYVAENELMARS